MSTEITEPSSLDSGKCLNSTMATTRLRLPIVVSVALTAGLIGGADEANDCRAYGRDPGGTAYSTLTQLDASNVSRLTRAWTYHTGESGLWEDTPIVADNVMFFATQRHRVVALDATTGNVLWSVDPKDSRAGKRGVSYWPGDGSKPPRIFVAGLRLTALDAKTEHLAANCWAATGAGKASGCNTAASTPGLPGLSDLDTVTGLVNAQGLIDTANSVAGQAAGAATSAAGAATSAAGGLPVTCDVTAGVPVTVPSAVTESVAGATEPIRRVSAYEQSGSERAIAIRAIRRISFSAAMKRSNGRCSSI